MRGLNFPVTSISVALYLPCWLLWSSFSKLSLKWICFHRINFQPIVTQTCKSFFLRTKIIEIYSFAIELWRGNVNFYCRQVLTIDNVEKMWKVSKKLDELLEDIKVSSTTSLHTHSNVKSSLSQWSKNWIILPFEDFGGFQRQDDRRLLSCHFLHCIGRRQRVHK